MWDLKKPLNMHLNIIPLCNMALIYVFTIINNHFYGITVDLLCVKPCECKSSITMSVHTSYSIYIVSSDSTETSLSYQSFNQGSFHKDEETALLLWHFVHLVHLILGSSYCYTGLNIIEVQIRIFFLNLFQPLLRQGGHTYTLHSNETRTTV